VGHPERPRECLFHHLIRRARTLASKTERQDRSWGAYLGRAGRVREPIVVEVARPRSRHPLAKLRLGRPIRAALPAEDLGLTVRIVQGILEAHTTGERPRVTAPADPGEPCHATPEACCLCSAAQRDIGRNPLRETPRRGDGNLTDATRSDLNHGWVAGSLAFPVCTPREADHLRGNVAEDCGGRGRWSGGLAALPFVPLRSD
jgi:hypothetical protein